AGPSVEVKVPAPKSAAKGKQTKEKPTRVAQQPKADTEPKANVETLPPPDSLTNPPVSDPPKTAVKAASKPKTEKPKTEKPKSDKPKKPDSRSRSATIAKSNTSSGTDTAA